MTIDMEIDTDAERARCPSCNAANVFLTHSVQNMDSRRHVECRICSMRGPIELSDADAIKAWNDLPRRHTPDRTNADAERVSDIVARLRTSPYMKVLTGNAADFIEAQSKALAEAREVKPLEWHKWDQRDNGGSADTIVGHYHVWTHHEANGRWFWRLSTTGLGPIAVQGECATEDEAKAAAQADYASRLLSAIKGDGDK